MNIYKISIVPFQDVPAHPFSVYVAAEFIGSAIAKARRLCVDRCGFRPFRGNSNMNIVRVGISNARYHPDAVVCALRTATESGERDVVRAIHRMLKMPSTTEGTPTLAREEAEQRLADAFGGEL